MLKYKQCNRNMTEDIVGGKKGARKFNGGGGVPPFFVTNFKQVCKCRQLSM